MDHCPEESRNLFPPRMFAVGEEPEGVRVTPYHKPFFINKILRSLDPDEVQAIRETPFGKLVEIAEKPTFSGRFGRFLLSRQLKVKKKFEAWFLFAGKPVRFSLREFAVVSGLNCGQYPPIPKKKSMKNISEKPYWVELFGTMREALVADVITMLKKKTISDRNLRIKYALLALLSSILLPTSHNPRISQDHAEKIKDLDQFLAYPWGRLSFEMLIKSIKERDEVSLSQKTIALKGFVLALQLVMIEAVPALTSSVEVDGSDGSDLESSDEADVDDPFCKKTINPSHAREIDSNGKVMVSSIITDVGGYNELIFEPGWNNESEDLLVDNLVNCIVEGFSFSNIHFKGGATTYDVAIMCEEARKEKISRRNSKVKLKQPSAEAIDPDHAATVAKSCVAAEMRRIEAVVKDLRETFRISQNMLRTNMQEMFNKLQFEIVKQISLSLSQPDGGHLGHSLTDNPPNSNTSVPDSTNVDAADIIQHAMEFANEAPTTKGNGISRPGLCDEVSHPLSVNDPDLGVARQLNSGSTSSNNPIVPSISVGVIRNTSPVAEPTPLPHVFDDEANPNLVKADTSMEFPKPTFSLGLTQEEPHITEDNDHTVYHADVNMNQEAPDHPAELEGDVPQNRRSKRPKVVPRSLVGEYECDKRILSRAWESFVNATRTPSTAHYEAKFELLTKKLAADFSLKVGCLTLDSRELSAIVHRSTHLPAKVLDVLMQHTKSLFPTNCELLQSKSTIFMDTNFAAQLAKTFTKFSKAAKKETFCFPPSLFAKTTEDCNFSEATRIYFPFNFDRKHWVGVCVDWSHSQVILLDCNTTLRSDAMIAKDMRPLSIMFPYLMRQAGKQLAVRDLKALTIERPRSIPQNYSHCDSGMTSILLIQAHAVAGVEVCKCITPDVLADECQRIAVMMYEDNFGVI